MVEVTMPYQITMFVNQEAQDLHTEIENLQKRIDELEGQITDLFKVFELIQDVIGKYV